MILMVVVLLLFIALVVWDAMKGFHIVFMAHASSSEMIARVGFRNPILSFEIQRNVPSPVLVIRLFDVRILRKNLVAGRKPGGAKKGLQLARSATVSNLAISADYGLGDPFSTSMALAAVGVAAKFLPFQKLDIIPDYLSVSPYLSIQGNATLKFGKTILKYVQNKR